MRRARRASKLAGCATTRERALLGLGVIAFAAGFATLAALQHRAFWTGRFDVGNLTQAVWSIVAWTPPRDHRSPGPPDLAARRALRPGARCCFVPLWWLWPDPPGRSSSRRPSAIAVGAIPLFLLARRHLASERAACCLAVAYLLYPATQLARGRRLPSGCARDAAPPRRDPLPRPGPRASLRGLRRARLHDEGAHRAGRGGARGVVRARAGPAARRRGDRDERAGRGGGRHAAGRAALRARRWLAVRRAVRSRGRDAGRDREDALHRSRDHRRCPRRGTRSAVPRGAASTAPLRLPALARARRRRAARDPPQRPLVDADAGIDPIPLHRDDHPRRPRRGRHEHRSPARPTGPAATRSARARRLDPPRGSRPRADAPVAPRAPRREARDARSRRHRARPRRRAGAAP